MRKYFEIQLDKGSTKRFNAMDTEVNLDPFPYSCIQNALSESSYDKLLSMWPSQSEMAYEYAHDRWWFNLLQTSLYNKPLFGRLKSMFKKDLVHIVQKDILPLLNNLALVLKPYYEKRFEDPIVLFPSMLQLCEVGARFNGQAPHVHYIHNPEYAFTVIIRLEDGGYTKRGTTLYKSQTSIKGVGDLLDATNGIKKRIPVTDVEFVPNSALAFVESPVSIFGTMSFDEIKDSRCRMILCHVSGVRETVRDRKEFDSQSYLEQMSIWRETGKIEKLDQDLIPWFEREKEVITSWKNV